MVLISLYVHELAKLSTYPRVQSCSLSEPSDHLRGLLTDPSRSGGPDCDVAERRAMPYILLAPRRKLLLHNLIIPEVQTEM
jgi:hypothetical protein